MRRQDIEDDNKIHAAINQMNEAYRKEQDPEAQQDASKLVDS